VLCRLIRPAVLVHLAAPKCRKRHLRKPIFAKFPGGHAPRPPWRLPPSALKESPYFPSKGVGMSGGVMFGLGLIRVLKS